VLTEDPLLDPAVTIRDHKVLSPCLLLERIGEGGMGVVYRAVHLNLGIEVAVKIVPPEKAACEASFVSRFRREARAAARINHQNVVRVFDVDDHGLLHYLVMEYVPGEDAKQRVSRKGPTPLPEALQIAREAALGLGAAHEEGIIHRDVKPGNLLISPKGHVKVGDLGLAKPSTKGMDSLVSMQGVALGSPSYMAPEQWAGDVTPATDVWALGATLYYLLVGHAAYRGRSIVDVMRRIATEPLPDLRKVRPDVPDEVLAVLAKATQHDPSKRYRDGNEMAEALAKLPMVATGAITDLRIAGDEPTSSVALPARKWLDEVRVELRSGKKQVPAPVVRHGDEPRSAKRHQHVTLFVAVAVVASAIAAGLIGWF
tara:strand:+ start:12380 stop:13492 length:1113 start_codon:yes stop_codon:yes gene_type:complete